VTWRALLLISFAVLSLLTVTSWYVWSVRRQLGVLAGNPALGIARDSWVPLFGKFFGYLYALTPHLTFAVLALSVWLFGWRVAVLIAVGLPVVRWILRPIAKEHARHMLVAIECMMEKEEPDAT
jgi:hypothetical protein